jgi:hypothetical protein
VRVWIGWLLLLPLAFAFWLTITIAGGCAHKGGGLWRLLGILASFVIGGVCGAVGYSLSTEAVSIFGWIMLIGGGLMAILGTWTTLLKTKETELEKLAKKRGSGGKLEKLEEQEKWDNMWKSAKEEARRILEQDKIDNYEEFSSIRHTLTLNMAFDDEANELWGEFSKLEWKSILEEAKKILEQGKIDIHKKEEREKFGRIYLKLYGSRDPEAKELWLRLQELKNNEARNRKR